nr:hypothetical protein [Tanacetum cinerariifolium]
VSGTVVSAAPDTSSLGASTFSVESQAKPVFAAHRFTDSTVITTAAMDSAVTRRKVRVSLFADSAADASPFLSSIAGRPSPGDDDSEYSLPYSEFKDWEVVRCLPDLQAVPAGYDIVPAGHVLVSADRYRIC